MHDFEKIFRQMNNKMDEVRKERENTSTNIKYLIEDKIELERVIREGIDAQERLIEVEMKLKENMCKYLGCKS